MLGSQHMTFTSDELKTQAHSTRPGQAYFAGTGPFDKTCGDCKLRGYIRESRKEYWSEARQTYFRKTYRVSGCAKFHAMAGRHGAKIDKTWRSCKYFEPRIKRQPDEAAIPTG